MWLPLLRSALLSASALLAPLSLLRVGSPLTLLLLRLRLLSLP